MFTVKQVAKMADLTPRTLRYYDQIGLLKPVSVERNAYRQYDESSLLRLQQILLYRELGMPLKSIRSILDQPGFNTQEALESHAAELRKRIKRLQKLISTVEKTIQYLKGQEKMSQAHLFRGFSKSEQAQMEQEAMRVYNPSIVQASMKKWNGYTREEKRRILAEGNRIYADFIAAIPLGATSREAQLCVERWRSHMQYFWSPDDEQLLAIADGYVNDPRFRTNFDQLDPRLAQFVRDAVGNTLSKP